MGHPKLHNGTPFPVEPLFLADADLRPVLVGTMKSTWRLRDAREGPLIPLAEQPPLELAGSWHGDPASSSPRIEPEAVLPKPGTDVVLIGSARPPSTGATSFDVGLRIGETVRRATVHGERVWLGDQTGPRISESRAAQPTPLIYEHAFGGIDRSVRIEGGVANFAANPVGTGYHHPRGAFREGAPLPAIEDPRHPIRGWLDTPPPAGFGFSAPHWSPRAEFAGTYDRAWEDARRPALPADFDPRHLNAAPPELVLPGRLTGDERVRLVNVGANDRLDFRLPALPNPSVRVELRSGRELRAEATLDTVIIDVDANVLTLLHRVAFAPALTAHDVVRVGMLLPGPPLVIGPSPVV